MGMVYGNYKYNSTLVMLTEGTVNHPWASSDERRKQLLEPRNNCLEKSTQ